MNEQTNNTELFFKEAKNKPWIIDIYIAIQAAIALQPSGLIDFNRIADDIMPRPDRRKLDFFPLGEEGIKTLGILFSCECIEKGRTDYHTYKFTRKEDGKAVVGIVKV